MLRLSRRPSRSTLRLLAVLLFCLACAGCLHKDWDKNYAEDKEELLARYEKARSEAQADGSGIAEGASDTLQAGDTRSEKAAPVDFKRWWQPLITRQMEGDSSETLLTVSDLFQSAALNSSQIKVFSDLPLIRETTIQEAEGLFDPVLFAEGMITGVNDPVGDELKTGGEDRFIEFENWVRAGIRQHLITGGDLTLDSKLTSRDNNSEYFTPDDQAIASTNLTLNQPLLKGRGYDYATGPITLADIDHSISLDEFRRQVEAHLLEIVRSFWGLYRERAVLVIKRRLAVESDDILTILKHRKGLDVNPSQLARVEAIALAREQDAIQAEHALENAEARLVALVNDPRFADRDALELVPLDVPEHALGELSLAEIVNTALYNRPEIDQVIKQIKAAEVRLDMAENELWPQLDLVASVGITGMHGDYEAGKAWEDQFDPVQPGYALGFRFEFPVFNNAAEARERRKALEVRQLKNQLKTTIESILLEAEVSARELEKNHAEMLQRYRIVESLQEEIDQFEARKGLFFTESMTYAQYLEKILDTKKRLADAEQDFISSMMTFNLARFNLQRAMGVLMENNGISFEKTQAPDQELPEFTAPIVRDIQ